MAFNFAIPYLLLLLPLPLLVYWLLPKAKDNQSSALRTSLYARWQSLSSQSSASSYQQWLHLLLSSLLWIALVVAIARPQLIGDPVELPVTGRDLLVSIDVSGSMEQQDLTLNGKKATRLWVVKHILADFIQRREGDRLGLILFGERAYLQTPLTFDLNTVNFMLLETEIGLAGSSRTAIGDGIGLAVKRLKERPAENRVLILLTDGKNNTGALQPLEAAKLAKHAGVRIYTIGVGADEMIIKDSFFGPRKINPSQDLDEATLTTIAETTGGKYFRARDEQELEGIYEELDKLEPVDEEGDIYRPVKELYYYPLAIGLALYSIVCFLSHLLTMSGRWRNGRLKNERKENGPWSPTP